MNVLELFAGAGGAAVGIERAGVPWVSMGEALGLSVGERVVAAGVTGEGRPRGMACPPPALGTRGTAYLLAPFPARWPFRGGVGARYRQIGNAVPPPLAEAVVRQVLAADSADRLTRARRS